MSTDVLQIYNTQLSVLSAFQLKKINLVDAHFLPPWVTRSKRMAWCILEENG